MPEHCEYYDCYVLVNTRDGNFVLDFLDSFLPVREEAAAEYEFPQYSDKPTDIYQRVDEIIDLMEKNVHSCYGLYWRSKLETDPQYAMVFYTSDGEIIIGLSVTANEDVAELFLNKLKEFSESSYGYYIFESPPIDTASEFRKHIKHLM